jgi:hypothetical protein
LTAYDAAAINRITKETAMKLTLQVLGIVLLLALIGAMNRVVNNWKAEDCVEAGGQFVLNTTDSSRSMCIMGN